MQELKKKQYNVPKCNNYYYYILNIICDEINDQTLTSLRYENTFIPLKFNIIWKMSGKNHNNCNTTKFMLVIWKIRIIAHIIISNNSKKMSVFLMTV